MFITPLISYLGCLTSSVLQLRYPSSTTAHKSLLCSGSAMSWVHSFPHRLSVCYLFCALGLYGYLIYLFLMTSAVWVFTFPHITQMGSPCPPSVLSGSFCSFCHELGQGAVPSRVLSVDRTLWALCVVITAPERNVAAFGGCTCTGLNGFPEKLPCNSLSTPALPAPRQLLFYYLPR